MVSDDFHPAQPELIEYLSSFILESRLRVFKEVLEKRTRYLTVVLEDLYQAQNASAVLRTAECFGVQDVHIIENRNKFVIHRAIAMGSNKWLNIHKYNSSENNSLEAVNSLRDKGYRIIATSPDPKHPSLDNIDLSAGKLALFFGTELSGISNTLKQEAEEFVRIPMYGFTESFNISVSVALCLQALTTRLHSSNIPWQLSPGEHSGLLLQWLRSSIRRVDLIEKKFNNDNNS
jgi:tRNA (guanosine-2'-O-)-methyltransferase